MLRRPAPAARVAVLMALLAILVVLAVAAAASLPGRAAVVVDREPDPGPSDTIDLLAAAPLPPRDSRDLAARLRGLSYDDIPEVVAWPTQDLEPGRVDDFWIGNQDTDEYFRISAELRLVSPHAYWYVQAGRRVDERDLQRAADVFESRLYPLAHQYFGAERSPGIDGDPHVVILHATLPGVAGYFSAWDTYPRIVHPYSNEREIIYLNLDAVRPGTGAYAATLAHELQHLIHYSNNPIQETWIDEGSGELAAAVVAGAGARSLAAFAGQPDVQLTAWSDQPGLASAHYQAAYLFLRYVVDQFGGPDSIPALLAGPARGRETFDRFLAARGDSRSFEQVYADWVVANLLDDPTLGDGRFGYRGLDVRAAVLARLGEGEGSLSAQVRQFGADYVELSGDGRDARLEFRGAPTVRLVDADPPSGSRLWWSNRADNLDSRLTREFDLSGLASATLRFKIWYDIEELYDWFYLMASTDGGRTWTPLPGRHTSTDNPTGNGLGPGWTGRSGGDQPTWLDEEVDLTPFVGGPVLLRFEYVTDQGYNARGVLIDDIELPELGFRDDGESDQGWQAEGFLRSDNRIPQRFLVRAVLFQQGSVSVVDVPVGSDGRGQLLIPSLGDSTERAVLVVSGLAPRTLEPATYELELTPP